jgi:sulfite exporter TauE/SafE
MIEVIASVIAASAVGSLHCTSMCGGLVAFGAGGTAGRSRFAALGAYNAARGAGYVTLGALSGAVGSTLDDAGLRVGLGRFAGALAAAVMIGWGIARLLGAAGVGLPRRAVQPAVQVPLSRLVQRARGRSPAARSAIVGGCTAALPCGFLHAFLVGAAGTGSVLRGALVMTAFFLGTLPAVVGLGLGVELLRAPLRRHASVVGALVLVGFGLASLLGRWSPASLSHPFGDPPRGASPSAAPPGHGPPDDAR